MASEQAISPAMSSSDARYNLSPDEQELLIAALASNQPSSRKEVTEEGKGNQASARQNGIKNGTGDYILPSPQGIAGPGQFAETDDSAYLGIGLDAADDNQFDFDSYNQVIGDFSGDVSQVDSGEHHEKRKSIDDKEEDDEGGGKRRESEGATGKKPGRKPLIAEPTTKRKAQNRAAQRAFRDRKEKHLKDLETKVEHLEKSSETTNHENGLLRAQVERLQIELKEYRKRLSWIGNSGQGRSPSLGSSAPGTTARSSLASNNNDFQFEFPRFGDVPANHISSNLDSDNKPAINPKRSSTLPSNPSTLAVPGVVGRNPVSAASPVVPVSGHGSSGDSPLNASSASSPLHRHQNSTSDRSFESFSGLFSPSIIEASRQATSGYFSHHGARSSNDAPGKSSDQSSPDKTGRQYSGSNISNTNSPASSYASQQNGSSIGTSPEPSLSSPGHKVTDYSLNTISEENQPQNKFGDSNIMPSLDPTSFNWFAQQNGGGFDPVLFGDYRESQDALASQDFGAFFNDAFPLPELGSPEHNFDETAPIPAGSGMIAQIQPAQDGKEAVVAPDNASKMIGCNKIWDRIQSMGKFQNGEIDMDNLCSELKTKACCSESGPVVREEDVTNILNSKQ